jgi:hypothetical protein
MEALIAEYADTFALAVSEVSAVKGAVYAPKIPPDQKFSTKVHQKPMSTPEIEYLHTQVRVLEDAGIIRPIHPRDVKCVSPIRMAKKAHEGGGLTHEELQHELNEECVRAGYPPFTDLPPRAPKVEKPEAAATPK